MTDQSTPVSDQEIWYTATRIQRDQGEGALLFALQRCNHLRTAGDMFHLKIWERIADALQSLARKATPSAAQSAAPAAPHQTPRSAVRL